MIFLIPLMQQAQSISPETWKALENISVEVLSAFIKRARKYDYTFEVFRLFTEDQLKRVKRNVRLRKRFLRWVWRQRQFQDAKHLYQIDLDNSKKLGKIWSKDKNDPKSMQAAWKEIINIFVDGHVDFPLFKMLTWQCLHGTIFQDVIEMFDCVLSSKNRVHFFASIMEDCDFDMIDRKVLQHIADMMVGREIHGDELEQLADILNTKHVKNENRYEFIKIVGKEVFGGHLAPIRKLCPEYGTQYKKLLTNIVDYNIEDLLEIIEEAVHKGENKAMLLKRLNEHFVYEINNNKGCFFCNEEVLRRISNLYTILTS